MPDSIKRPFTFDRVVRIIFSIAILVGIYFLLKTLSSVLLPFLVAWLLAYMIYPIVCFFQYKCKLKSRIAAIAVTLLGFATILGVFLYFAIPPVLHEFARTTELIELSVSEIRQSAWLPKNFRILMVEWIEKIDMERLLDPENIEGLRQIAPHLVSFITNSLGYIISGFVVFIIFLYIVFLLLDYEILSREWVLLIPQKYRSMIEHIAGDLKSGMNRFFRGQGLIALFAMILLSIGFEIIDLPLGLLLGIAMGVLTLIPYLKLIMVPPLVFFALLKSMDTGQPYWVVLLSVFAVLAVVQILEDLILIPKIMGKAMSLNPAVILLSLSVWGTLLGVIGMIIALPVTTILISYYKRFIIDGTSIREEAFFERKKKPVAKKETSSTNE